MAYEDWSQEEIDYEMFAEVVQRMLTPDELAVFEQSGEETEAAAFRRFRMALANSDDFGVAINVVYRLRL
jgi:hypothetical protein